MSELEQMLNELNKNGELIDNVEVDMDDLDIINFYEEKVPEGAELAKFEPCIHIAISTEQCDPVNLKCNKSCKYTAGCIFNPYSEYYNMSLEEFKECIAEQQLFEQMLTDYYKTPEGQEMLKELQEGLIAILEEEKRNMGERENAEGDKVRE